MSVAEQLRALRSRAGLSMGEMAAGLGLKGPSSYQRYEDSRLVNGELPLRFVRRLVPVLAGRGNPPITEDEVKTLAGDLSSFSFKGDWLDQRLAVLHKTKAGLAKELGLAPPRIVEIVQGKREVQADEIRPMARYLEWPETTLLDRLGGHRRPEPAPPAAPEPKADRIAALERRIEILERLVLALTRA